MIKFEKKKAKEKFNLQVDFNDYFGFLYHPADHETAELLGIIDNMGDSLIIVEQGDLDFEVQDISMYSSMAAWADEHEAIITQLFDEADDIHVVFTLPS